MAYQIFATDGSQTVRLIRLENGAAKVMRPFDTEWQCDPCASYRARYTVRHPAGNRSHAWHEVITQADDARTRFLKYQTACNVARLALLASQAERMYRDYAAGIATDTAAAPYLELETSVHEYLRSH